MANYEWCKSAIWSDKWITNIHGGELSPYPDTKIDRSITVETIIDWNTRSWNMDSIRPLILNKEANAIQPIPIGITLEVDCLVWPSEKNGKYSVRFGYHNIRTSHQRTLLRRPSPSMLIDSKV